MPKLIDQRGQNSYLLKQREIINDVHDISKQRFGINGIIVVGIDILYGFEYNLKTKCASDSKTIKIARV